MIVTSSDIPDVLVARNFIYFNLILIAFFVFVNSYIASAASRLRIISFSHNLHKFLCRTTPPPRRTSPNGLGGGIRFTFFFCFSWFAGGTWLGSSPWSLINLATSSTLRLISSGGSHLLLVLKKFHLNSWGKGLRFSSSRYCVWQRWSKSSCFRHFYANILNVCKWRWTFGNECSTMITPLLSYPWYVQHFGDFFEFW